MEGKPHPSVQLQYVRMTRIEVVEVVYKKHNVVTALSMDSSMSTICAWLENPVKSDHQEEEEEEETTQLHIFCSHTVLIRPPLPSSSIPQGLPRQPKAPGGLLCGASD